MLDLRYGEVGGAFFGGLVVKCSCGGCWGEQSVNAHFSTRWSCVDALVNKQTMLTT